MAWITRLRVDSTILRVDPTILSVDFHSKMKWSLIWLLNEWISTPAHLESICNYWCINRKALLCIILVPWWPYFKIVKNGFYCVLGWNYSRRPNGCVFKVEYRINVQIVILVGDGTVSGTSSGDISGLQGPVSWSSLSITSGTRLKTKSPDSQSKARISIAYNINYWELLLIAAWLRETGS